MLGTKSRTALLAFYIASAEDLAYAYTSTPLTDVIVKMANVAKQAVLVLGGGLGFLFVVNGIRDLAQARADDIQTKRRGTTRISGGLCLMAGSQLIDMLLAALGIQV